MGSSRRAADDEAEERAESAAAEQPVVHDDQPADADHGSPAQGEVVGGAEFAGESVHGVACVARESGANYKAFAYAMVGGRIGSASALMLNRARCCAPLENEAALSMTPEWVELADTSYLRESHASL